MNYLLILISFFAIFSSFSLKAQFKLYSNDFHDGKLISSEYTCDGAPDYTEASKVRNFLPHLAWQDLPEGTNALALIIDDLNTDPLYKHWMLVNIPREVKQLLRVRPVHASNSLHQISPEIVEIVKFKLPCPPEGSAAHTYRITLFALKDKISEGDINKLKESNGLNADEFKEKFKNLILDSVKRTFKYKRK